MTFTIRGRLTLWFTLAFSVALLLVVGVLTIKLFSQLDSEIRSILHNEENWITTLTTNEFGDLAAAQGADLDSLLSDLHESLEERYGLKRQFAVAAISRNGEKLLCQGGVKTAAEFLPKDFFEWKPRNYGLDINGDRYRVRLFILEWGAVAVGAENEIMHDVVEEAGKTLIWLVPIALLLAIAGGWLMARLALRPVLAAAHTADSISLANLRERLPHYPGKDEFGALVATLNRMIARVEEGVKRLQQFTQDAAHELRTPLTILRGELELAYQDENHPEEMHAWLQKILDRVIGLGQIVDNLMLLARSDSDEYPVHKTRFRLDRVLQDIFEDMQILAEGRPLEVRLDKCEAMEFFGDELLIRRLLLNLCDNAMKYTASGSVTLCLQKNNEQQPEFSITDTGVGIPSEEIPHVFDRFYRVDKSHSSTTGGSGLGLAICQWIVLVHEGEIEITSEVEKGTTIRVTLPEPRMHKP